MTGILASSLKTQHRQTTAPPSLLHSSLTTTRKILQYKQLLETFVMAKKSQANTTADVAGNDNSESQDDTIGKENNNSLVITPEVLEAMSGRSLVGMDGRKRRIHVDTQESGFTTNKPHPEDVLLGRGRPVSDLRNSSSKLVVVVTIVFSQ
jgi:hypothetical protein